MKRQIILTIEPHEDGVRCGECPGIFANEGENMCRQSIVKYRGKFGKYYIRGPECLAAEAKWRAVSLAVLGKTEEEEAAMPDDGRTHFADEGTLMRMRELEREVERLTRERDVLREQYEGYRANVRLRGLLRECVEAMEEYRSLEEFTGRSAEWCKRIRAALGEEGK